MARPVAERRRPVVKRLATFVPHRVANLKSLEKELIMYRMTVGILGVVAGLAAVTPGLVQSASAADALNGTASLHAQDMSRQGYTSEAGRSAGYQPVEYYYHHHHHHYDRRHHRYEDD